jgi:mannose-6-phosphate isomerase-like protein (cupin superfamily)
MTAITDPTDVLTVGSDRIALKLTSDRTGGELAVFEVAMPPGGGLPMLHRHDPCELYRVRSGELAFYVAGRDGVVTRTVAGPGAVVPIRGGIEHTIRNESAAPAEAIVVFSPGEAMERFARAAGALGPAPSPDDVLGVATAHGIEITRPIQDALAEAAQRTPYVTLARFSGDGDDLLRRYRQTSDGMAAVGGDHGLIAHAAARTDDGLLVVNLWPSKECSDAAARDPRRQAALRQAAISPDRIRREHHDVVEVVVP